MTQPRARSYCSFWLGEQRFGVDIHGVKEIAVQFPWTMIPHAPGDVVGYVSLRGHIHLLINVRKSLELPDSERPVESRFIFFKPTVGESFGILVDRVGEIVTAVPEAVEGCLGRPDTDRETPEEWPVVAVAALSDGLMMIVDPRRLLDRVRHRIRSSVRVIQNEHRAAATIGRSQGKGNRGWRDGNHDADS